MTRSKEDNQLVEVQEKRTHKDRMKKIFDRRDRHRSFVKGDMDHGSLLE
jgi:hypothetical protein